MSAMDGGFILDLRSTRGKKIGALPGHGSELSAREWTTWLRIRSDITGFVPPTINPEDDELTGFVPPVFEHDGLALLATMRDSCDLSGRSIGLFHARIDAEELAQLGVLVERTPWADLPRPAGGDFNAPTLDLSYEREGLLIRRRFNAASGNFIQAIAPLWAKLDGCLTRARKSPASSMALAVEIEPDPNEALRAELRLTLRTRGIGHVALSDPRSPSAEGPRLRVVVSEVLSPDIAGMTQDPVELPIPPAPEGAPPAMILRPHDRFTLTLPWTAPRPGLYLVEASWRDYGGPVAPVPGQTLFMPLPVRGPSSLGSGPYPIRGAVFATRRFTI